MISKIGILKTVALATGLSVAATGCAGSQDTNGEPSVGEETMLQPEVKGSRVLLETSMGSILIGFYPDQAPLSVENFLAYVEAGHYDGPVSYTHLTLPTILLV